MMPFIWGGDITPFGISFFLILGFFFMFIVGGAAVKYLVEYWGSYFKNERVVIPFLVAGIGGVLLGRIAIPAAIFTWILSYMIDNEFYKS
ncbi:hypothetical protein BBF96_07430 [Anoxybacter fermentans]|uniref:Uncharacterized protein n=1 Tax=Anoxybacter fermentans TaxID=1323375 RepID=A0A3S9SY98_9FIRM|nr:hypothetical protein [Anoxybacter fermentans]AZR73230.1 hypothetical protein BBF96_07430 [Anoxybacter fermentans]